MYQVFDHCFFLSPLLCLLLDMIPTVHLTVIQHNDAVTVMHAWVEIDDGVIPSDPVHGYRSSVEVVMRYVSEIEVSVTVTVYEEVHVHEGSRR